MGKQGKPANSMPIQEGLAGGAMVPESTGQVGHRAPGAGHRGPGAGHRAPGVGHCHRHRGPGAGHRAPGVGRRGPGGTSAIREDIGDDM